MTKKKAGEGRKKQIIYCGPSVTNVVTRGSIFLGFPPHLDKLCSRHPILKQLFVPVEIYPQVKRQLAETDSAMSAVYAAALKSLKEEK